MDAITSLQKDPHNPDENNKRKEIKVHLLILPT